MNKRIKELEKELKLLKEIDELKNEPQLEIGQWYNVTGDLTGDKYLVCVTELNEYSFKWFGFDRDTWVDSSGLSPRCKYAKATPSEVEQALIKEAKKRGFKEGVRTKGLDVDESEVSTLTSGYVSNVLKADCKGQFFTKRNIFKDGIWAEIIDTPLEINGKKVEINEGARTISIGCKITGIIAFKRFVEMLEHLNILDFNNDEVGTVTTKQFKEIYDKL